MTISDKTAKQGWRPPFSLRALIIVITLVRVYFWAWEITTSGVRRTVRAKVAEIYGEDEADNALHELEWPYSAPMPFVMEENYGLESHYYVWFFGLTVSLPFQE